MAFYILWKYHVITFYVNKSVWLLNLAKVKTIYTLIQHVIQFLLILGQKILDRCPSVLATRPNPVMGADTFTLAIFLEEGEGERERERERKNFLHSFIIQTNILIFSQKSQKLLYDSTNLWEVYRNLETYKLNVMA